MNEAVLYVPIGPPGCGKSTFAEDLVAAGYLHADAVISPDHYRRVITGSRADQSANATVFSVCGTLAQARLSHGLDVYFDATNISLTARGQMDDLCCHTLARRVNVIFDVSLSALMLRNDNREHPVPEDVLQRMIIDFRNLSPGRSPWYTPPQLLARLQAGQRP